MATTVRITVLNGPHKKQRFCFRGQTRCLLGRAEDCFVKLAGDDKDLLISRHHCRLDIDPPCVSVHDLGSLNGTYVNAKPVEPAEPDLASVAAWVMGELSRSTVKDGDILTVGGTSLQVDIVDCPPPGIETAGGQPVWAAGEVAKRDCPVDC